MINWSSNRCSSDNTINLVETMLHSSKQRRLSVGSFIALSTSMHCNDTLITATIIALALRGVHPPVLIHDKHPIASIIGMSCTGTTVLSAMVIESPWRFHSDLIDVCIGISIGNGIGIGCSTYSRTPSGIINWCTLCRQQRSRLIRVAIELIQEARQVSEHTCFG